MSGPCDIKSSGKAWNDGVDAFRKAFKQSGGKTTKAIAFALEEIRRLNPDFEFDNKSFIDPLIASLKEKGLIEKSYQFRGERSVGNQRKIEKIAEKMQGLSPNEKKTFARKAFSKFEQDGVLTEQDVRNIYAEAVGVPAMDEKLTQQIGKTSKALQEAKAVDDEINKTIKEMQEAKDANDGKLKPDQDRAFSEKFKQLAQRKKEAQHAAMREQMAFSEMLMEKKFWLHQLTDYMPLNLMNPNSLAKNAFGAIADMMIRSIGNTMAPAVSKFTSIFTGVHSNPLGSKAIGAARSEAKAKAEAAWRYGHTEFSNELAPASHLNAAARLRRAMDATGFEKFKGIISALLKIHPNVISKGLTVPDAIVFEMVRFAELNRIADAKGLTGAEKDAFLLKPDDHSVEVAKGVAQRATFKQDLPSWMSGISKISSYDPHEQTKKLIAAGASPLASKIRTGLYAVVLKSAVPFIKTPINIVRTASKVLLPEYELAEALIAAKNEKDAIERQRLIIEGTTKAAAGMFVRYVALQLVAQGLISAGYSDEDRKTKDLVEQEMGGPNRINLSALIRGLTFQDTKKKKGDNIVDLSSLGAFGIVMAVYAHAFNKYGKEEIKDRAYYNKNLLNSVSVPWDLAWAQLSSSLDFTFFTGINQLQGAIQNKEGYEANQLATQYIANLFTGVLPSTYQKLSTQESPEVKKQFDKDLSFGENLANALGYRFAFYSDDLKNKYFSLAEKDKGALKKKNYMLFDNYMGRVLDAEMDFTKLSKSTEDSPVSRLYEATREVGKDDRDKLFPSSIADKIKVEFRKKGKKIASDVQLTPDQHGYLQEQASNYRMMLATPYIMSNDFKTSDFETRTKVLQNYYNEGLKYSKNDLMKKYPEIKGQTVDTFGAEEKKNVKKLVKKYKTKNLK